MTVYPQMTMHTDALRSMIKMDDIVALQADVVALTNRNLSGAYKFWRTVTEQGGHPALGLSVPVMLSDEIVFLFMYARNNNGWQNLIKLSSAIETRELDDVPLKWLKPYSVDCHVLLPNTETWTADQLNQLLKFVSKERLLGGISRTNGMQMNNEREYKNTFEAHDIPLTAMQEVRYLKPSNSFAYDVLRAIDTGSKISSIKSSDEVYFLPTREEWVTWFSDCLYLLENTETILKNCKVDLDSPVVQMPKYTGEESLEELCMKGLKRRIHSVTPSYTNRLRVELQIIQQMDYEDYFLIVADFMHYAKENNILTGPGRGSSASSLVAFCLYITHVDPLEYGLLFERFLNPDRISLPDIDIDFEDTRRKEVIDYVHKKYGAEFVVQIGTEGKLTAKAVARDVGRVFGFTNEELDHISSLIPDIPNPTLRDIYEKHDNFRSYADQHTQWFEVACQLEGLTRNTSTHAAGVVLSPVPVVNIIPLTNGSENIYVTQWPMEDVEKSGMLKMDFLGLKTLTLLKDILQYTDVRLDSIPLNDSPTIDLFKNGQTLGIFQFESPGMQNSLRTVKPNSFKDIVAVNALYRPGPMAFINEFAQRKNNNKQYAYAHELMKLVLDETYGIMVYQEQIMQVASVVASYTFAEADLLRRSVSKKDRDVLKREHNRFVTNSIQNGITKESASAIYEQILKFADYGFPKSHAVAYSLIAYQLAFLKARYPNAFYSGLLNQAKGNTNKIVPILNEMRQRNIPIYPPNVMNSEMDTAPFEDGVLLGLNVIKGIPKPLKELILEHQHKSWDNLFEFAFDLSPTHFQERYIVPLIHAGALDSFYGSRQVLINTIPVVREFLEFHRTKGEEPITYKEALLLGIPKYASGDVDKQEELFEQELSALGFYLNGHPATHKKEQIRFSGTPIIACQNAPKGAFVDIVGTIERIKRIQTKKGEAMAFLTIQDETGSVSCTLFPRELVKFRDCIQEKQMVRILGNVEHRNSEAQVIVKQIESI